ncbi:hypothetical protein DDZ13_13900 [Coraliomargarita sinensis]|uniref:Uncharacterized protein n=1 Tax=Coraliomargarita sinensis TaxID=2174842 RepID=A0A317ZE90_9BACT|nr:hypothetical protein DDZ13_13900 [Coraliomargarita sinensis]
MFSGDTGHLTQNCCESPKNEPSAPAHNSDKEDCPHQSYKSHQQVTQKDINAEQTSTNYAPVLVALIHQFGFKTDRPTNNLSPFGSPEVALLTSPPGRMELYCVYRI